MSPIKLIISPKTNLIFIGAGESAGQILFHLFLKAGGQWYSSKKFNYDYFYVDVILYDRQINQNIKELYAAQAILNALENKYLKIKFKPLRRGPQSIEDILGTIKKDIVLKPQRSFFDKIIDSGLTKRSLYIKSYRFIKEKSIFSSDDWIYIIKKVKKWEKLKYGHHDQRYFSTPPEFSKKKLFIYDKLFWNKKLNNYNKIISIKKSILLKVKNQDLIWTKDRNLLLIKNTKNTFTNNKIIDRIKKKFNNKEIVISPCNSSDGYGVIHIESLDKENIKFGLIYSDFQASKYRFKPEGFIISEYTDFLIEAYIFLIFHSKNKLALNNPIFFKKDRIPTVDNVLNDNKIDRIEKFIKSNDHSFFPCPLRSQFYIVINKNPPEEFYHKIHKKSVLIFNEIFEKNPYQKFLGLKFGITRDHKIVLLSLKSNPCDIGVISGVNHNACQTSMYLYNTLGYEEPSFEDYRREDSFIDYSLDSLKKYNYEKIFWKKHENYIGFPLISTSNIWGNIEEYSKVWQHLHLNFSQRTINWKNEGKYDLDKIIKNYRSLLYTPYYNLLLLYYKPEEFIEEKPPRRIFGHFVIMNKGNIERNIKDLIEDELIAINASIKKVQKKLSKKQKIQYTNLENLIRKRLENEIVINYGRINKNNQLAKFITNIRRLK